MCMLSGSIYDHPCIVNNSSNNTPSSDYMYLLATHTLTHMFFIMCACSNFDCIYAI